MAGSLASGPRVDGLSPETAMGRQPAATARAQHRKVNACEFLVKTGEAVALHLGVGTILPHVKDEFRVDGVALLVPGQGADHRVRRHRM